MCVCAYLCGCRVRPMRRFRCHLPLSSSSHYDHHYHHYFHIVTRTSTTTASRILMMPSSSWSSLPLTVTLSHSNYYTSLGAAITSASSQVPIRPGDRFIDLGSGVGQVVLQVSAEAMCVESFGVEKQDNPAQYAKVMEVKFKEMMNWFGKMCVSTLSFPV